MGSTEGPLVSFCVKCYNQERYIGEALEGAFAQTYRPLEIVISDDASTDRSWEIIQAAVEGYRRRPEEEGIALDSATGPSILEYLMRPVPVCAYCSPSARAFAWRNGAPKLEDWLL